MQKKISKTVLFLLMATVFCLYSCEQKVVTTPVSIIFDTDIGPDYDDVGAMTLLHAMADSGEVKILATLSCNVHENTVPCIDVINTYYGRPDIPIGAPPDGVNLTTWHKIKWTEALPAKFPHKLKSTAEAPNAVQVYRRALAAEPDTSVVVVTVGFFTNLAALLQSPADQYSELNGMELVRKKVKHLVSMAGGFVPEGSPFREFNVQCDSTASITVFETWPTRIIISGFEIGSKIKTGKRLIASDIQNTPAKEAFTLCLREGDFNGRQSWDQTAVLIAARGTDRYFNTVKGRMIVAQDGSNTWQSDANGKHEYVTFKMPVDELTRVIEDMMMHEPKQ